MPRVFLNDEQKKKAKEQDAIKSMRNSISDCMATKMNRERLNRESLGKIVGISRQSVSDILSGNDVRLNISTMLKLFYFLGMEVS